MLQEIVKLDKRQVRYDTECEFVHAALCQTTTRRHEMTTRSFEQYEVLFLIIINVATSVQTWIDCCINYQNWIEGSKSKTQIAHFCVLLFQSKPPQYIQ